MHLDLFYLLNLILFLNFLALHLQQFCRHLFLDQKDYEKLKKDPDFTIVGYVADPSEENSFIASDGSSHKLIAQGWDSTQG